jgi:membrane associated rhomboid family serine protease
MGALHPQPDAASTSPSFVCFTCGPVAVSSATAPCPACSAPVYDLASPDDRAIAEYAMREREKRRGDIAIYLAMLAGIVGALALAAAFDQHLLFSTPIILCVGLILFPLVRLILRRQSAAGERAMAEALPDSRPRSWPRIATGVPVVAAGLLVLLHLIVGGRLDDWWLVPARLAEQPIRLLSHALVHASWWHLLNNAIALVLIGIAVDLRVGRLLCTVLLVASAVAGGLAHAAMTGAPETPMVGASGAVYGLLGASLALMPARRYILTLASAPFELPGYVLWPLFVSLYTLIDATSRGSHVAWLGHMGGLVAGIAIGLWLRRVAPPAAFLVHEARREERLSSARSWM